jgi:two-component system nitrate/nitrite response regulator NarL
MMTKLVAAFRAKGMPAGAGPNEALLPGPARRQNGVTESSGIALLSAREREILTLIARGDSNKVIARRLGIAETTVKIHVQHILRKLQLSSRVQAAVYAAGNGLG